MEKFREVFKSLTEQLDDDYNLSSVLEFCTYFRCSDVNLYYEFMSEYKYIGDYKADKLVEMYCKINNINLTDENANDVFRGIFENIWNNGVSYHLTTSVSAINIAENGMDPRCKESEVVNDIEGAKKTLSEDGRCLFFPFYNSDVDKYSYASIPKFSNNYGFAPEWFLNVVAHNRGDLNEALSYVVTNTMDETEEAQEKMFNLVSKYYGKYKDSIRTLVVIPGLYNKVDSDIFKVDNIKSLNSAIDYILSVKKSNIDAKTDKVVSPHELMFIGVNSKKIIDFNENNIKK